MSFEDIPYSVGDTVSVPEMVQATGQIVAIEMSEEPGPICVIRVGFSSPDREIDYCFNAGDAWDMHFTEV